MQNALHPIQVVVRRTGLTAHVIRIWEKRYQAVKPQRTETNRRLYSEEQIKHLGLLRDLTRSGQSIGLVAKLPSSRLQELAAADLTADRDTSSIFDQCLAAVRQLEAPALESALQRGTLELGAQGLLQRVIAPLVKAIGESWREGALTAAHEHFASGVIRLFLGHAARPFAGSDTAPALVVATPTGQLHELGAMLAGAAAANLGWRVIYLGASLPAAEIAGTARLKEARAVAISLVYPEDDPQMEAELTRLRALLPTGMPLLVGGRAQTAYREAIGQAGALAMDDLAHFCQTLDQLRLNFPKPLMLSALSHTTAPRGS